MNKTPELTRRQVLATIALGVPVLAGLTGCSAVPVTHRTKNMTFLLVHGAWHGGWCWKKLMPLLQAAGYGALAPTLTGLGERAHLLNPQVDLNTHIQDVAAVLEYEDLRNVVLVGHSYGGMVIAGVAENAGARISHVVYLDAFLPENGKAVKDYMEHLAPAREDGWRVPPLAGFYGVTDANDIAWMSARLGDQPLKTFTQPVQLSAGQNRAFSQAYIRCTDAPFFQEAGGRAKQQGFKYRELLSAGHDAMVTKPRELASLLMEVVS